MQVHKESKRAFPVRVPPRHLRSKDSRLFDNLVVGFQAHSFHISDLGHCARWEPITSGRALLDAARRSYAKHATHKHRPSQLHAEQLLAVCKSL